MPVFTEKKILDFFGDSRLLTKLALGDPLKYRLDFLRSLTTSFKRFKGYGLLLSILNKSGQNSPIFVNFVRDLHVYPELKPYQEKVPNVLNMIFTTSPQALKMRKFDEHLATYDGLQITLRTQRESSRLWTFYPVDNKSRFYIILNSQNNQGIGVVDWPVNVPSDLFKRINLKSLGNILKDGNYHWEIYPIAKDGNVTYVKFINKATGSALDANGYKVYPHSSNDGHYQHWELH
ncbi:unnamed protein product [Allacma fusca]|uniref:Ricin B lectin domain-containing protein n=1 Tax=Allacma fusca TaxID=39272 RepID=A0A8J2NX59_9HEXA|nr:unnamed protein product [Allacma fusca]